MIQATVKVRRVSEWDVKVKVPAHWDDRKIKEYVGWNGKQHSEVPDHEDYDYRVQRGGHA